VMERALRGLLAGRPHQGAAFVVDLTDVPVQHAWRRSRIMNQPIRPGAMSVGTLGRMLEDGAGHLDRARAADREIARHSADRARALAGFARSRPASLMDRGEGEVGAASAATRLRRHRVLAAVSEWAVDEVAVSLRLSSAAAEQLLTDSLVLVEQLPTTLALLEEGRIGWAHARVLTELLGPVRDGTRAEAEARVLSRVDGKTPAQLRVATRRAIAGIEATAAAGRLVAAIRERQVALYPGEDGMAGLSAVLPVPVARACLDALERYADACAVEGDDRTKRQRMADSLVDLILRPGENGLPPVQVQLTVVATADTMLGGDEPGEVDGDVVPAPLVRELAYAMGLLPRPPAEADPDVDATVGAHPDAESTVDAHPDAEGTVGGHPDAGVDRQRRALGELLGRRHTGRTTLSHRPRIAVVDRLRGTLVALTDAAGIRRGEELRPPPDTPGYRPRAELDRFVRLRDRRCRFPGCRARPRRCDLDHTRPWPGGPTSHTNLCALCEHHHRLSHQAPGWSLRPAADGGLAWHAPGGEVVTTFPPRFGADDDLPAGPPTAASQPHPPRAADVAAPPPSTTAADGPDVDEPPF
jgi:hypothetical protein